MVYVFLADGFEETEALVTVDILRRAKIEVVTVSVGESVVRGSHGIKVTADITAKEFDLNKAFEGVILPGGMPGTLNLQKSDLVQKVLKKAESENCVIAAICAAPMVLGEMGLLKGKKAVCYPGFEEYLVGAEILDVPAVKDKNIITGKGAGAVFHFAFALCDMLTGNNIISTTLKEEMQCDR